MSEHTHPKVTIGSPSEQLVSKAQASVDVTDARGRVITLRKPGALAQYRLVEALGTSAENNVYVSMVLPMIYVAAIEGDAIPPFPSKLQIEALIQRLDEEGIAAVLDGVKANYGKVDPEADKAALKN